MQNLTSVIMPRIDAHRLDGLDAGPDVIYPYYGGLSLVNIPSSICALLGVPGLGAPELSGDVMDHLRGDRRGPFQHVILLVVDGMGLNTLEAALRSAENEPDLSVWRDFDGLVPLTSIVPSTTAAALTTFWTGAAPSMHGVIAYEVWLKEYSMIANMIRHAPVSRGWDAGSLAKSGFDPSIFLPLPTLGPHLSQNGVRAAAFQHFSIARSGLSSMLMKEIDMHPFLSLSDLWVSLDALLDERIGERMYTYIYWGDLDEHSHFFSPEDQRVAHEFSSFSRQLGDFLRRRRARRTHNTLLLVTADHGHIATPKNPAYELRNHPELRDCLVMYPSGEARLPLVYLRPGREEKFLSYLEAAWPGEFIAISSDQALEAGLFGEPPHYHRTADRIGDLVIIPRGSAYWFFGDYDNRLLGRHGGMSRTEMLVPLLSMIL